jgi:hypothetical protein
MQIGLTSDSVSLELVDRSLENLADGQMDHAYGDGRQRGRDELEE